jgi:3-oxoacyl-[acyl-carrier protein] reductase
MSNDTNEQTITNKILAGKVALVTGGSRGLGVAIAYALANEGANVAVSYVSSAEKEKKLGVRAAAFQVDQGDPSQAEGLIQSVVERFGQLDILVNNAAVGYRGKTIDSPEIDNERARRILPYRRDT